MRIVAGIARGLRIEGPDDDTDARPTSDKVREALFNIIDVSGSPFLDLFAGSGAVGCEALSRGASRVVLVEQQKNALKLIARNIEKVTRMVKVSGEPVPPAETVPLDVMKFISSDAGEKFDYIFCDPPYALENSPKLIGKILAKGMLNDGGMLIFETSSRRVKEMPEPDRIRKYGDTSLLFYRKGSDG